MKFYYIILTFAVNIVLHLFETQTYNLLLLAEEGMALQRFTELTLGDICKNFILSFISRAVGDSTKENNINY